MGMIQSHCAYSGLHTTSSASGEGVDRLKPKTAVVNDPEGTVAKPPFLLNLKLHHL